MKDPSASLVELLSFGLGIVGLAASVYFYLRSKETPKPVWRSASIALIGGETPLLSADVDVRYKGESVQSLSKSYIAFWNSGRKTINGSDIAASDSITFKNANANVKILDAHIIRASRDVNKAALVFDDRKVDLIFDFLDQNDGVTVEIIHTGPAKARFECGGTIKGIPQGIRKVGEKAKIWKKLDSMIMEDSERPMVPPALALRGMVSRVYQIIAAVVLPLFAFGGAGIVLYAKAPSIARDSMSKTNSKEVYASSLSRTDLLAYVLLGVGVVGGLVGLLAVLLKWRFRIPPKISLTAGDVSANDTHSVESS